MSLVYPNAAKACNDVFYNFVKSSNDAVSTYSLAGRFYVSKSGWGLLAVPNDVMHGAFKALDEPGIELPPAYGEGQPTAHISVMTKEEVDSIGGPSVLTERGKLFRYNIESLKTAKPDGWDDVSKVWFFTVKSPELQTLRKSYGLSPIPKYPFHITVAVRRKNILRNNEVSKVAAEGIPDRGFKGDINKLQAGQLLDMIIQHHIARKAGPHFDLRFGDPKGLYSWATRKGLPSPGGKILLFRQPMHSYRYKDYEGVIPEGYGAGTVKKQEEGKLLVTKVSPRAIHFTLASRRTPERFVLLKPETTRSKKDEWLLINKSVSQGVPFAKEHYARIPADKVEDYIKKMTEGDTVEAKIDGASSLIRLMKNGVELLSYRKSKVSGRPITYTERFFGKYPDMPEVPKELVGSVLKGEIYGVGKDNKPIGVQELGGLLNMNLDKYLAEREARGVNLKNMVYDIQQYGNKPIDTSATSRQERRRMMEEVLKYLPDSNQFHLPEAANTPDEALKLWEQIKSKQHPLTNEGIVIHPSTGKPIKSKLMEDKDVYVTGVFPGEGKYKDVGAGGFTYSLEPDGPTIGNVGTGFSDSLRKDLLNRPDDYIGRVAKVKYQQQYPNTKALRVPVLIAFHEDYPHAPVTLKTADILSKPELGITISELEEVGIIKDSELIKESNIASQTFMATPISWNKEHSIVENIANYLNRLRSGFNSRVSSAYNDDSLKRTINPEYGFNRLREMSQGVNSVISNPIDQTLMKVI